MDAGIIFAKYQYWQDSKHTITNIKCIYMSICTFNHHLQRRKWVFKVRKMRNSSNWWLQWKNDKQVVQNGRCHNIPLLHGVEMKCVLLYQTYFNLNFCELQKLALQQSYTFICSLLHIINGHLYSNSRPLKLKYLLFWHCTLLIMEAYVLSEWILIRVKHLLFYSLLPSCFKVDCLMKNKVAYCSILLQNHLSKKACSI